MSTLQVQVISEVPAPKRSFLRQVQIDKERCQTINAEYHGDKDSAQGYEIIEENDSWNVLCEEISRILEKRGINAEATYISDFLVKEQEAIESANDVNKSQKENADKAEFNLHLSKLTELQATLILLRLKYHYSFGRIGSLMNISDQQADNFYQIAQAAFDSDDIQNTFFQNHVVYFDSAESYLTGILLKTARAQKSAAGRPTKSQARKAKANNLVVALSRGDLLELGV